MIQTKQTNGVGVNGVNGVNGDGVNEFEDGNEAKFIFWVLNELSNENKTNTKMQILQNIISNPDTNSTPKNDLFKINLFKINLFKIELLKKVFRLTYDKANIIFGIKKIPDFIPFSETNTNTTNTTNTLPISFAQIIDNLFFFNKNFSGNKAINKLRMYLEQSEPEGAEIIKRIINRDLKINMNKKNINKVFNNLILDPPYMRCDVGTKTNLKKLLFPVYSQIKADGMFMFIFVSDQVSDQINQDDKTEQDPEITFMSRSGEINDFNQEIKNDFIKLSKQARLLKEPQNKEPQNKIDFVLFGEVLVDGLDRSKSNGLLNSLKKPDVYFQLWDILDKTEYTQKNGSTPYSERFKFLETLLKQNNQTNQDNQDNQRIKLIPYKILYSINEINDHYNQVSEEGFEGLVIKTFNSKWKNGTHKEQLKIKQKIVAEFRIIGFKEGRVGTKREKTFGSIKFRSEDNKVTGYCSGINDTLLETFNKNREDLINKIISIEFNSLSSKTNTNTNTNTKNTEPLFSLTHPRFIEIREDKTKADDLESIKSLIQLSRDFSPENLKKE